MIDCQLVVVSDNIEGRLTAIENDEFVLTWINAPEERLVELTHVPRALYDEVAADTEGFRKWRTELTAGPFVDFHRLLIEAANHE